MMILLLNLLVLLEEAFLSHAESPSLRPPVDCVRASDMCNQSPQCSSRYRIMRQCLVGRDRSTMLANRECQAALEVLQESALYECRCKRGMKKELQCLQNYWSIHMGLSEGEDLYETSPYESISFNQPDTFRLASIISGMDSAMMKASVCSDTGRLCNPCLDAAKACNMDDTCKRMRSLYISTCAGAAGGLASEPCNRKRCHKALRQFLERVPVRLSYRLLFCSCRDQACGERRRQTIVPSCSYEDKTKPNCLEMRRSCRSDPLCRSRLADFHMNCETSLHSITSCPNDNYQACLTSYAGLVGTDMTPNYVDGSHTNFTISPWCTCRGSGNQEEDCEAFLKDFRENVCLRNAIQAFEFGPEPALVPIALPVTPSTRSNTRSSRTAPPPPHTFTPSISTTTNSPALQTFVFGKYSIEEITLEDTHTVRVHTQEVVDEHSLGTKTSSRMWTMWPSILLLTLSL